MKRKEAQANQSSVDHTGARSSASQNAGKGIVFEEATGKTVDFIRYAKQSKGSLAFEIRFTDGTFLFVEPVPQLDFRVRLLKISGGNVRTIREYGITR